MDAVPEVVHDSHKRCTLLGGTFAVLVQVGLGLAAISTLVYKRHHERPRRPWIVWIFDTTKQCFAGALQHCVNLAFGVMFAVNGAASECSWYLVNFAITVGCGVFLLWGAMRLYTRVVDKYHLTLLRSGDYGSPPSWRPWLAQLLVWGLLSASEKLVARRPLVLDTQCQRHLCVCLGAPAPRGGRPARGRLVAHSGGHSRPRSPRLSLSCRCTAVSTASPRGSRRRCSRSRYWSCCS